MLDINKLNFNIDNVISDFSSEDEKSWIRDIVIELNQSYPKQFFNVRYDRFTDLYVLHVTLKNSIRN